MNSRENATTGSSEKATRKTPPHTRTQTAEGWRRRQLREQEQKDKTQKKES